MERLKERIRREGVVLGPGVLRLDSILNHGADPALTMAIGEEFARRFAGERITKVVTVESSGIAPAFATACALGVPLVFARRRKTLLHGSDAYVERVPSFTKGIVTDLVMARHLLEADDSLLFVDDMIASGHAARGLVNIVARSGAKIAGIGIVVEKTFQEGGRLLRELGFRVESLVKIASLDNGAIRFEDEPAGCAKEEL